MIVSNDTIKDKHCTDALSRKRI